MANIAKAYVQIIPSASEITPDSLASALSGSMDTAGKAGGSRLLSGVKKVVTAGIVGVSAAVTAAVVKTAKDAVAAYADYEQLAGGTELLYGDAAASVMQSASEAYKTMQMSANDYLRQVNGFSTGLKNALGGDADAAAELADRIVQAEADVVAATGVESEAVQNAFNGIMRNNYTMLDNLQLGIAPTKEGFQELINSVNEYNKAQGRATDYQIDNLADAQAALVDYIAMQGIAGYAAMEGGSTIQGALASTKAAWQNLLVGFNSGADISVLVQRLVESASGLAQQVAPVITGALSGIFAAFPQLVELGGKAMQSIVDGIIQNAPQLVQSGVEMLAKLISTILANLPQLFTCGGEILIAVAEGLVNALPTLTMEGYNLIKVLISAIGEKFKEIKAKGAEIVSNMKEGIFSAVSSMKQAGANIVQGVIDGIKSKIASAVAAIQELGSKLAEKFRLSNQIASPSRLYKMYGNNITEGVVQGITAGTPSAVRSIADLTDAASLPMRSNIARPAYGAGRIVNIYPKELSRADIDYILTLSDEELGGLI